MKNEKDISAEYLRAVGKNVKKIRKEKDLSLEELGLKMGLTKMHVHRIEKGHNITLTTLLKLMIALDVECDDLLEFDRKFKKGDLEKLVENSKGSRTLSKK